MTVSREYENVFDLVLGRERKLFQKMFYVPSQVTSERGPESYHTGILFLFSQCHSYHASLLVFQCGGVLVLFPYLIV